MLNQETCTLIMARPNLNMPEDWASQARFRFFAPGDEALWAQLGMEAGVSQDEAQAQKAFNSTFWFDRPLLDRRMVFMLDEKDREIATMTAWFDGGQGALKWLMTRPGLPVQEVHYQLAGRGLELLKQLDYTDACLNLCEPNEQAVRGYLRLGFFPLMCGSAEEKRQWNALWGNVDAETGV